MAVPAEAVFCKLRGYHRIRKATIAALDNEDYKCMVCGTWYTDDDFQVGWRIETDDGVIIGALSNGTGYNC